MRDGIEYLGIERVLQRGTGSVLEDLPGAQLVYDSVSGAYFLDCADEKTAFSVLDRYAEKMDLLSVTDAQLGALIFEKYSFRGKIDCWQVAYYGEKPSPDGALTVRTAQESDLPMLREKYDMLSSGDLEKVVARGAILLGIYDGRVIGFIGEHLEGSMGLLQVFPEYRNRGFGTELEKHLIAATMDRGFVPFGQVEKDNLVSLRLQEKIGLTRSGRRILWMWR